jgi:hypothetical protein
MTTETLATSVFAAAAPNRPRRHVLRSIGAVTAGLVSVFAVTTFTDVAMHATHVFPPLGAPPMSDALFALALAYRFVYDLAGSYLTAYLAPRRPMQHALALGAIGVILSAAGAIALWNAGPHWYPLALAASAMPSAWLGARLSRRAR